ncbi:hypothetical protein [Ruminiclostridium josui]|uniref:hypothetical protein n=1 Tax=Ruminiclostridium josui TaxID=1499 RepID=UPI000A708645|nr:hypothetical protein [Ruminiclostridium josui]
MKKKLISSLLCIVLIFANILGSNVYAFEINLDPGIQSFIDKSKVNTKEAEAIYKEIIDTLTFSYT